MDDLKNEIWDFLFQLGEPQPIEAIAQRVNASPAEVQQAVDDPWFEVEDDLVSVAY